MKNRKRRVAAVPTALYDPEYDPTAWEDMDTAVIDPEPYPRVSRAMMLYRESNDYDRVTDQVLTGAIPQRLRELAEVEGVRAVVDACDGSMGLVWRELGVKYLPNLTGDDGLHKPPWWFARAYEFVKPALEAGDSVLLHCGAGINRGPSMAYFVLRAWHGMSREQATVALSKARPVCEPDSMHMGIAYRDDADKALKTLGLDR